jgi:hypothetical protein
MRVRGITGGVVLAAVIALAGAAPAAAATGRHVPLVTAGILGSIFGSLGHAVLGAFSWTVGLASKFILTTIGALVRMLIPRSWANKGVEIMEWIVAVPNYAGTVTTPAGRTVYGFGGINALRDLFTWIGVGLLPLTLLYGTTRAMLGERGHVAVPIARVLAIAAVLVSYPYWWTEAAAMTDTVTHMVLTLPRVASGLHQLMLYAVDGIALGGWELVDLAVMAFVAIELLSLIFLKVVIILLGALLYATGPLTIGLVATESGAAVARAWASAVVMLVALPVAWATLFAVGALLLGDAGTAGPLIAGHSSVGALLGGVLLAVAGAATLWMCLRVAREAMGLLRLQLGGLLALSHRGSSGAARGVTSAQSSSVDSLRRFGARVASAAGGAAGQLATAGPGGAAVVRAGRAVGYVGRHGVLRTAAAGGRAAAGAAAPQAAAIVGRSRAGAVAVRMAKAGTAGWHGGENRNGSAPVAAPNTATGTGGRRNTAKESAAPQQPPRASKPRAADSGAERNRGSARESRPPASRPQASGRVTPRPAPASATRPGSGTSHDRERRSPRSANPPQAPPQKLPTPPRDAGRRGKGKR